MLEMTEALIHHARFLILRMTGAEFHDIEWALTTAQNFVFQAGQASCGRQSPEPEYLPAHLRDAYHEGYDNARYDALCMESEREIAEELAEWKATHPDTKEKRHIYCPNGHNSLFTTSGYEECAACGHLMSEDDENSYYQALTISGQCM